jgi:ParB family chromosome partitioning protein
MTTELRHVPLDQISFGNRARDLDLAWVDALAGMIRAQGLIQPITVRVVGEGYRLVSGLRRFMAFRQVGALEIPCTVSAAATDDEARLEEVMENLGRQELKALDRCHHLYELKKVWERMHPETAHGGDRKSDKIKRQKLPLDPHGQEIFGFSRATAEKIGLSERTIRGDVKTWKALSPASRATVATMPMADKMTELKALSEQKPPRQAQILALILDPAHQDIQNVAEALFHLENGITPNMVERRYLAATKTLGALDDVLFDRVIMAQEERVIASLKRRGRI